MANITTYTKEGIDALLSELIVEAQGILYCIYSGSSYPARPDTTGPVIYIGPVEPTTWLDNDIWVKKT